MTKTISVGDVCEGTVTSIKPYGLLVEVNGVPGLLRIPELSWELIRHPSEVAKVGDRVRFQVLNLNDPVERSHEHFNGSIKILKSNPSADDN